MSKSFIRKICLLALSFVIMMPLLAACRRSVPLLPERGFWEDGVFTSEYLGIRFVLPPGWIVTPFGGTAETADGQGGGELYDIDMRNEMMASCMETGAVIHIMYERFLAGTPSVDNIFETAIEAVEHFGGTATRLPDTTEIGPNHWHSIATEFEMRDTVRHGRQFFYASGGVVSIIVITFFDDTLTVDDVLHWIIGINDPIPEPR